MKYFLSGLFMLFGLAFYAMPAEATSVSDKSVEDAIQALERAYEAQIEGDLIAFSSKVIDLNYPVQEEALEVYRTVFPENPMIDYEIIEELPNENGHKVFLVIEEFSSGYSVQGPSRVTETDEGWKVVLYNEITEVDDQYAKVITPARFEENISFSQSNELTEDKITPLNGMLWRAISGELCHVLNSPVYPTPPSRGLILNISSFSASLAAAGEFTMFGHSGGAWRSISNTIRVTETGTFSMGLTERPSQTRLRVAHLYGFNPNFCLRFRGDLSY